MPRTSLVLLSLILSSLMRHQRLLRFFGFRLKRERSIDFDLELSVLLSVTGVDVVSSSVGAEGAVVDCDNFDGLPEWEDCELEDAL